MKDYNQLPIYKSAISLNISLEKSVRRFSRYHKYSIGEELRKSAREIIRLIIKAWYGGRSAELIAAIRDEVERMKCTLAIAGEIKAFPGFGEWGKALEFAHDLGKQSQGWLNHVRKPESLPRKGR